MKKQNFSLVARGESLYLHLTSKGERVRMACNLKDTPQNRRFVERHYLLFLHDKKQALSLYKKECEKADERAFRREFGIKDEPRNLGRADAREIFKEIAAEKAFLKIGTRQNLENRQRKILAFLEDKNAIDVRKITRQMCVNFAFDLKEQGLKSGSIKNLMQGLNQLLNAALQMEIIAKNPFFMPKLNEDKMQISPFTLDEAQNLIKAASGEIKSYLIVAFFTGARTGEILGLKWSDIDFDKKEIKIERTKLGKRLNSPKTKSSNRVIDMLPLVENELKSMRLKAKGEFLFSKNRNALIKAFNALQDSLNLAKRRLYDTRHSFASIMLSRGEEAMWVGCKMMGHKSVDITFKVYAKYLPKKVSTRAAFLAEFETENEPNLFDLKEA